MAKVDLTQLIEAGAHFGHLTRRWNPKMKKYIFMEKNGIHIIDLKKTQIALEEAAQKMHDVVASGKKVLYVGTKKQAKSTIASEAARGEMNWVSERWLGGMLTNFSTIRKSIKRLQTIDKMESDGTFEKITKKERLIHSRERDKLRKILNGVETMQKLPGAIFVVDIKKEAIAIQEAHRLNIPIFAIVDTNCDPDEVDYCIPANDDAVKTIEIITKTLTDAAAEGNIKAKELRAEEDAEKEKQKKQKDEITTDDRGKKVRVRKFKSDEKKPFKAKSESDEAATENATTETSEEKVAEE
ncbi:MAG: 30S ribosomal protein S2 [Ignavibacteria bacterium]|nr:30S ribosomal protein S2 [Ignavibacteria bacterium]